MDLLIANLINLRYQAKNAHWNCKGMLFYQFHLLFDRIYEEYEDIIDRLAERYVGAGNRVSGTIDQASKISTINDQTDLISALDLAGDLLSKIKQVSSENIALMAEEKDQANLNIMADLQEILYRHIYLLESSLR